MHYCDHPLSIVRRPFVVVNVLHFRLLPWKRWTEFDKTWQEASTQYPLPSVLGLFENQDGRPAYDWPIYFRLLVGNRQTEFYVTWHVAGTQCPLQSLCFSVQSENQHGRPGLWLNATFRFFSSETTKRNKNKIDRKQELKVIYHVCVFLANLKTKMATRPLIGLDIFDFFSGITERKLTKRDRKQELNVLYNFYVFRADLKTKMVTPASDSLKYFRLLLWTCWLEFDETSLGTSVLLDRKQELNVFFKVCAVQADLTRGPGALYRAQEYHCNLVLFFF